MLVVELVEKGDLSKYLKSLRQRWVREDDWQYVALMHRCQ